MTRNSPRTAYARRLAAVSATGLLLAGSALAAEATAVPATGTSRGSATAVAFRAALDVSRAGADGTTPLRATLNEVRAPGTAEKKTLDVTLDQVNRDRPVRLLQADAVRAKADVADGRAEATSRLERARVHVPGLPALSLVEVEQVTATATCASGQKPVAESQVLGPVTALGKRVPLAAGGTATVEVPGVGTVRLSLSQRETTSATAAATSLRLQVSVDPLRLGVEKVEGTVTLAQATCRSPQPASESPAPSGRSAPLAQSVAPSPKTDLAETGGSPMTPYLLAVGAVLVTAGGTAAALAGRRSRRNR
ncbi:SCO1860 family LAETG-anchored protein [Streptomyces coeruleorubidus]|nr:SCO1860 family LAETG-anchored protein [Streptomyces coeruleorubidus]WDV52686.1 SCO1860 family LAETG-anchored protein [Streptomyces coeruleorubidus]